MKLSIFLVFATTLMVSASVYSQNTYLTMNFSEISYNQLFREIERQTEFRFAFSASKLDSHQKVKLDVKDETLEKILDNALPAGISYEIFDRYVVIVDASEKMSAVKTQQQPAISGTVTDESGQPLPGVTVMVTGSSQGTITNSDGEYSLANIPEDATLVFSFVGMRTEEVEVGNQSKIDVTLKIDAFGIEEVVAIGYGAMRKSDLTGSVTRADIKAFNEAPNTSIMQSLQGTVAGLNVGPTNRQGQNPGLSIRGSNNLGGSSDQPLIVLDGAIYNASLSDINPSDIESVDILKDASSAAIYGASAANGVIIITTKRGISDSDKPLFSYSTKYTMQSAADLLTPLDREGFIQLTRNSQFEDAYLAPDYIEPNPDYDITADWGLYPDFVAGYENGVDFDFLNEGLRDGSILEHNLSMRQKTKNTSYYISGGYTNSKGIVDNDNFKRYSVRMNIDNQLQDWLKIGLQSFVSSADYTGRSPSIESISKRTPLANPYLESGELDLLMDQGNPLRYRLMENEDKRFNLFANAYAQIDVPWVEGLSYRLAYTNTYRALEDYEYDPTGREFQGSASKQHDFRKNWQLDNTLSYKRKFNIVHDVNITLVAGRKYDEGTQTGANSAIFALPGLLWNRLEDGAVEEQRVSSGSWDENNIYYMARGFYSYKSKYLLTATVRRDGYSVFGVDNKWGTFPSAAAGWVFSKEDFINLSWLDYGKLRLSYGQNGANTVSRYSTLARISSGFGYTFEDQSAFFIAPSSLSSSELKWETTTGLNLGLDYYLFNYRLVGTFEYYNTKTEDILYNVRIPDITGFSSQATNIGQVDNWGIEATLNTVNIKTVDFTWNSTFVYSRNRNSVVSVLGNDDDGDGKEDDLISSGLFIGEPKTAIYHYNYQGIYQIWDEDIPAHASPGLYRWEDISGPDGEITPTYDRKIIGYSEPAYRWSFKNEFNYKNLSLMVFINSIQGGNDRYYARNDLHYNYSGRGTYVNNSNEESVGLYWTPTNTDAIYRQLFQNDQRSSSRYFQRSFVRLQDVSLSYDLPKESLTGLGIHDIRIFASGKNLYTWTKWLGGDPELGNGLSQTDYPLLRTFTLGLNLTF